MIYKYTLAIDPSGNFEEGKGTTGWVLWDNEQMCKVQQGVIEAKDYTKATEYWRAHVKLLTQIRRAWENTFCAVIEEYTLYEHKAKAQINSKMETPKIIGILQMHCDIQGIPYYMQPANAVKTRWTDKILRHKGYLPEGKIIRHVKDAIRHAVHFATFKNKEV